MIQVLLALSAHKAHLELPVSRATTAVLARRGRQARKALLVLMERQARREHQAFQVTTATMDHPDLQGHKVHKVTTVQQEQPVRKALRGHRANPVKTALWGHRGQRDRPAAVVPWTLPKTVSSLLRAQPS